MHENETSIVKMEEATAVGSEAEHIIKIPIKLLHSNFSSIFTTSVDNLIHEYVKSDERKSTLKEVPTVCCR